jgi:hypothetical protein
MAPLSPSTVLHVRLSISILAVVPLLTAATGVLLAADTWSIAAWMDPFRRTVHTATLAVDVVFPGTDWQTATPLAIVQRKADVTIAATASDNVGVTKVEFYVDNGKKCTDTTAPFSCVWQTPNAKGSYVITARAYDAKGNVTASATITIKTN